MSEAGRVQRELALRAAVLAGDVRAWEAWYAESFAALFAYAQWRSGGRHDWAEEIVQETWLVAVRRIARFDPVRASFQSWLRGIAANVIRNQLRLRRRRTPAVSLNGDLPHSAMDVERSARIAEALAAMPAHYEEVLRAKYLDGRSVEEIAKNRSESAKAIESLLSRARQAFRECYGKERDIRS